MTKNKTDLKAPKGYRLGVRVLMRRGQELFYFMESYAEAEMLLKDIEKAKLRPTILAFTRENSSSGILDCSEVIEASITFRKDDGLKWIIE